jgi:predicted RNA binding protein YcfA (HicA-like mRNA interferase family)
MTALHLIRLLNEAGWYEVRQKGSHKIFKHDEKITTLVVPSHGAKDIPIGTLNNILKMAGLK